MVLESVLTVYQAISSGLARLVHEAPGVTMFGFKRHPSMRRCWLNISCMTAKKIEGLKDQAEAEYEKTRKKKRASRS